MGMIVKSRALATGRGAFAVEEELPLSPPPQPARAPREARTERRTHHDAPRKIRTSVPPFQAGMGA
jgi:hypothetical protein